MSTTTMRTIRENLLIELEETKHLMLDGFVVKAGTKDHRRIDCGRVVAVSKTLQERGELKVGDRVLVGKYSGVNVEFNNVRYLWLSNGEVMMVLDQDEDVEIVQTNDMEGETLQWELYTERMLNQNRLGEV